MERQIRTAVQTVEKKIQPVLSVFSESERVTFTGQSKIFILSECGIVLLYIYIYIYIH